MREREKEEELRGGVAIVERENEWARNLFELIIDIRFTGAEEEEEEEEAE